MINWLRKAAQSTFIKIFLGLIILSFAALPLSGVFVGSGSSAVAVVDGHDITPQSYARAVQTELNRLNQEQQSDITIRDFRTFGADQFLLNQMIHNVAVQNEALKLGISLPDSVIKQRIAAMPAFKDLSGQFSQDQFRNILKHNGLSTTEFVGMLRNDLIHQMLLENISAIAKAPVSMLEAVATFQEEQRTISYVMLPLSMIDEPDTPNDDIVEAYYKDHSESYMTPEYRTAQVLYVNPDKTLNDIEITNEEIESLYKRRIKSYETPERRQLGQIVFDTQEEADTAVKRLLAGELFEKIALEKGKQPSDVNLGYVIKGDLLPEIADGAFFPDNPGIVGPIKTNFGYSVIDVKKIEPSKTKQLDDVRDDLVKDLRAEKLSRILPDFLNTIEDSRAGGATLSEIAQENNFIYHSITLDVSGRAPGTDTLPADIPPLDILTNDIFLAELDEDQDIQELPSQGLYLIHLDKIIEPRVQELAEIKDKLVADWKREQRLLNLEEKSNDLAKMSAEDLQNALHENNLSLNTIEKLKRSAEQAIFSNDVFEKIFRSDLNETVVGQANQPDTYIVARVDEIIKPTQSDISSIISDLEQTTTNSIQQDISVLYSQALVARQNVEINNDAMQSTLDRIQTY